MSVHRLIHKLRIMFVRLIPISHLFQIILIQFAIIYLILQQNTGSPTAVIDVSDVFPENIEKFKLVYPGADLDELPGMVIVDGNTSVKPEPSEIVLLPKTDSPESIGFVNPPKTFEFRGTNVENVTIEGHPEAQVRYILNKSENATCAVFVMYLSRAIRKPVFAICEQQRRRSACASAQSDQHLCCSPSRYYNSSSFYIQNFKRRPRFCGCAGPRKEDW